MLDKLIEFLDHWGALLLPFEVVDAYEAGVVLRFGRYHRGAAPGLNWKWPLAERILTAKTCVTTMRLPPQTLVTRDGCTVVVGAIVKYEVRDVQAYLLCVWDSVDVLADVSMGAIKRVVNASAYADLQNPDVNTEARVTELVRKEVNEYGFKILRTTFIELARVKALRLLGDTTPHAAGGS